MRLLGLGCAFCHCMVSFEMDEWENSYDGEEEIQGRRRDDDTWIIGPRCLYL